MIYTVTLNPSVDYHLWIPAIREGTLLQVQKEWKAAGGKGINVSRVLKILGMESTALGFVGGFTGAFIRQQVEQAGIAHQLVAIEQDSRINLKIKAETETDISGAAPVIPPEAAAQLMKQLDELLGSGDDLVLAGSIPQSLPGDFYQTIMRRLRNRGVRIFLDAKGDTLRRGLAEAPFLIKPNHHELGDLFGVTITTTTDAIQYGQRALEMGAQNVIVSMAGQGAVFVNRREVYVAAIPPRKPVNSVGAGDAMVAGYLYADRSGMEREAAFRFAVAAGSTTALSEGFCTQENIDGFLPEITIQKIK